jgi:hypothetical protein
MLKFGELKIVEKTFTREPGGVRGQAYDGIKFRRYDSAKGKKAAEEAGETWTPFVEENFIVSNKAWAQMSLEEFALIQAVDEDKVFILVVDDQDQVEPKAKFCRRSVSKDGKLVKKGKMFSNEFLTSALVEANILDKEKKGNQYLTITDVTKEVADRPDQVRAIFYLVVDESVDATQDTEEQETASVEEAVKGF